MKSARLRLATAMLGVAILALVLGTYLGVERGRWTSHYRRLAEYHAKIEQSHRESARFEIEMAEAAESDDDRWARHVRDLLRRSREAVPTDPNGYRQYRLEAAEGLRKFAASRPRWINYHAEMKQLYTRAAARPWGPSPSRPTPPDEPVDFLRDAEYPGGPYRPAESWWSYFRYLLPRVGTGGVTPVGESSD